MSEPEMLFAFVRTANAHLEAVFNTSLLRKERNLQKLRDIVKDSQRSHNRAKRARKNESRDAEEVDNVPDSKNYD